MNHSHYHKSVKHLETIDVYRVLQLFGVTDPCLQHAVKKLLCAGQRGVKPMAKDVQEAIDSLNRWLEMQAEDAVFFTEERHPLTPNVLEWPADDRRIDVIGQNGNDGAAYKFPDNSTAPEGATHWHEDKRVWLQDRGSEFWLWVWQTQEWCFYSTKKRETSNKIFEIAKPKASLMLCDECTAEHCACVAR